jgi:hypothetical protein
MRPSSQQGVQIVVDDVEEARRELIGRGVAASEVDVQPWGSFVTFSDPDGNSWALHQLPQRTWAGPVAGTTETRMGPHDVTQTVTVLQPAQQLVVQAA